MNIEYLLLSTVVLLLIVILIRSFRQAGQTGQAEQKIESLISSQSKEADRLTDVLYSLFSQGRQETAQQSKDNREELRSGIFDFSTQMVQSIRSLTDSQLAQFSAFTTSLESFQSSQKDHYLALLNKQSEQNSATTQRLDQMRETMERKLAELQAGNEKKLEEMRATVDEKLQKTLETRLAQSFELVSKNLESVQKGLGDMQQLATGVGDLKKVLSNVKTRGILGEVQLGNILEQILTPDQYDTNVITKPGSRDAVEYAVRIPQKDRPNEYMWMPLDAKFPVEDYYTLMNAYDTADSVAIESASKALDTTIKKCAKDIHDKYICPPDTTDVGLMFLPIEGLYAEVVRNSGLVSLLHREYKIIITGPTTLSAILSSFAFGFRTMAIEQRSGEIRQVLSAVKTEFGKFGDTLKKAQEKINRASEDIDELVGTRSRKIQQKLKNIEMLPQDKATMLLDGAIDNEE